MSASTAWNSEPMAEPFRGVTEAFRATRPARADRWAVMVPIYADGDTAVTGRTIEGDDARVKVVATAADREVTEVIGLADLWRLPMAGLRLVEVSPAVSAVMVLGFGQAWGADGQLWSTWLWDLRGAAIGLLQGEIFKAVVAGQIGESGRAWKAAKLAGPNNARVIAASTAATYLAEQVAASAPDNGLAPLWWSILSCGPRGIWFDFPRPPAGDGPARSARLRTAIAGALSLEVSGRKHIWAEGSTRRWLPLYNPNGTEWNDPTGDLAVEMAEGSRGVASHPFVERPFTPQTVTSRPAVGQVIEHLRAIGLTERQAWLYANVEAGFKHHEVAEAFGVEPSTVSNTVANVRRKLDLAS